MIADPMSDLSGGQTPKPGQDDPNTKEIVDVLALQTNFSRVERIRTVMGIASGCSAGILGLTSLEGLGKRPTP